MNADNCTAFSPLGQEACLPTVAPFTSLSEEESDANIEILFPGTSWELVTEYPLAKLQFHPLQNDLFVGIAETGIQELATDIRKRGLQNPLEILPDGTIVNGHQRYLACKSLKKTQIPVYIRHDLAEQPASFIEECIVQDNLQRKNLHPLEIAGCYKRLREIVATQEKPYAEITYEVRDLRNDLARRFNISGRTLDRYVSALKAPWLIQCACIRGKVPMEQVSQIGRLPLSKLQAMMALIEETGNLPAAVAEFARQGKGKQSGTVKGMATLIRRLMRDTEALAEEFVHLPYEWPEIQDYQPALETVEKFFATLLEALKNPPLEHFYDAVIRETLGEDVPKKTSAIPTETRTKDSLSLKDLE